MLCTSMLLAFSTTTHCCFVHLSMQEPFEGSLVCSPANWLGGSWAGRYMAVCMLWLCSGCMEKVLAMCSGYVWLIWLCDSGYALAIIWRCAGDCSGYVLASSGWLFAPLASCALRWQVWLQFGCSLKITFRREHRKQTLALRSLMIEHALCHKIKSRKTWKLSEIK